MRLVPMLVAAAAFTLAVRPARAQQAAGYQFAFLSYPGAQYTTASGVNDAGQVVGYGTTGYNAALVGGFVYQGGAFTTLAYAGAEPLGVSGAGVIVGNAGGRGFVDSAGVFRTFAAPGGDQSTVAAGVNSAGQVVGSYADARFAEHGYAYQNGAFATLDFPVSDSTYAGYSHYTQARGINDAGQIVGNFTGNGGFHGFRRDADGTYAQIDAPGMVGTSVAGINNRGDIVGTAFDASGLNFGFVDRGGAFTFFRAPDPGPGGPFNTSAIAINDAGVVVGAVGSEFQRNGSGVQYGFIATPLATAVPEPGTLLLAGAGVVAAGAVARRRARADA